jgi:hypothetical protein
MEAAVVLREKAAVEKEPAGAARLRQLKIIERQGPAPASQVL